MLNHSARGSSPISPLLVSYLQRVGPIGRRAGDVAFGAHPCHVEQKALPEVAGEVHQKLSPGHRAGAIILQLGGWGRKGTIKGRDQH